MLLMGASRAKVALGSVAARAFFNITPPWSGDIDGVYREPFLDRENIDNITNLTMSVNKPTKDGGNPLFEVAGTNTATADYQKLYHSVIYKGSTYHLIYGAHDDDSGTDDRGFYATSSDGETWTKPDLDLFSYDGNTDNNIIIEGLIGSARWIPGLSTWVAVCEKQLGGSTGFFIYTTTDDPPDGGWTLAKTVTLPGAEDEGRELLQSQDGRWLGYYISGHSTDRRKVNALRSVNSDIDSDYTPLGVVLEGTSTEDQRYNLGVDRIGELHYGFAMVYAEASGQIHVDLVFSRDGLSWEPVDTEWIPLGTSSAFDDEMIWSPTRLTEVGNDWHIYYVGSPVVHDAARPKDMRLGRATIGKGRIGQIAGTGSVTTEVLHPTTGQTLSINCDASGGGKIEVEILDSSGVTVSGYSQAAATDITTDTFATSPSWTGPIAMPVDRNIKIRFHLTSAVLYGYTIS